MQGGAVAVTGGLVGMSSPSVGGQVRVRASAGDCSRQAHLKPPAIAGARFAPKLFLARNHLQRYPPAKGLDSVLK